MSEYRFVEHPFLAQLEALGWGVIDQGEGIPKDPAISHRQDFREVVLKGVFKQSISKLNLTDDGQEWLNDKQPDAFWSEIDKVMQDYRDRKEWLKQNGAGMDI